MTEIMESKEFYNIVKGILNLPDSTKRFIVTCEMGEPVSVECEYFVENKSKEKHEINIGGVVYTSKDMGLELND